MGRRPKTSSPSCDSMEDDNAIVWKYTKTMNMQDLARDDDYLSHLFIEKLGGVGSANQLLVHRMDPRRRLPKTDAAEILAIVQGLIVAKPSGATAIKQAVNELLGLTSVIYYLKDYSQSQINAFATHASRYLELYLPSGSIEIAQTSRYSKYTGKNELCILATRPMQPGFLIAELKGSMADLTEEEDRQLKKTGPRDDGGTRRDFSVIHSKQLKKNHLFLGPARFVNHDCDNNCELFRNGRYITFRAIKPIAPGQEITAHYGNGYFGRNNRHCLCETCERLGRGGYAPQSNDAPNSASSDSDGDSDSDSDYSTVASEETIEEKEKVNLNERRTRRGVYLVLPEQQDESDESEEETEQNTMIQESTTTSENALDGIPEAPSRTVQAIIDLTTSSPTSISAPPPGLIARMRPSQATMKREAAERATLDAPTPKSIITTRGQKAREASMSSTSSQQRTVSQSVDPPSPLVNGRSTPMSTASTPSRTLRTRVVNALTIDKAASYGPSNSSTSSTTSQSASSNVPKRRGRPPKNTETVVVKVEEKDDSDKLHPRPIVARQSAPALTTAKPTNGSKDKAPTPQEKPVPAVPCCVTCSNPLPIDPSTPQRKGKPKEVKEECARCKRHFIIYSAPWPQRTPLPGSGYGSRENTPSDSYRSSSSHSMTNDQRLKVAWLAQIKRAREKEAEEEQDRAVKKRKTTPEPPMPVKNVSSFSGRTCLPSLKVRERDGPEVKMENGDAISLHANQRAAGKKRFADGELEEVDASADLSSKKRKGRRPADDEVLQEIPLNPFMDENGDDRRDKSFWPAVPPLPPPGVGIRRTGLLNFRPNPTLISRWRSAPMQSSVSTDSTPTLVDDDTDNDVASDDHPSTPENDMDEDEGRFTSDIETVPPSEDIEMPPSSEEEEEKEVEKLTEMPAILTSPTFKSLGLIAKPNPGTLAKRTWAPPALIIADPDDEVTVPQELAQPRTPPRRRRQDASTASKSSPVQPGSTSSPQDRSPASVHSVRVLDSKVRKPRSIFDDYDASSGEEDVILPGPSDSKLYLLQSRVSFNVTPSSTSSPFGSPLSSMLASPVGSANSSPSTVPKPPSRGADRLKVINLLNDPSEPLPSLGPFHSAFHSFAPPTGPSPSFVNAGWESDSSA